MPADNDSSLPIDPTSDSDDAHRSIGYFSGWIMHADGKIGVLAAVSALLLGGVSQQVEVALSLSEQPGPFESALLMLLAFTVGALAVGGWQLTRAMTPRVAPPTTPNRFSFPSLSRTSLEHLPAEPSVARDEAWEQAQLLARIAEVKFARLRLAVRAVALAILALVVFIGAAAALEI